MAREHKPVITEAAREAFLAEFFAVCVKHGVSIEHEDNHGAFILTAYNDGAREWMENAHIDGESPDAFCARAERLRQERRNGA